jgi:hypothetical protein
MPSQSYYIQQARALLSWARATKDRAKASRLRVQAAKELERAKEAGEPAEVLDSVVAEFNAERMLKKRDRSK